MPESCGSEEIILSLLAWAKRKQAVSDKSPHIQAGLEIPLKCESMQFHPGPVGGAVIHLPHRFSRQTAYLPNDAGY